MQTGLYKQAYWYSYLIMIWGRVWLAEVCHSHGDRGNCVSALSALSSSDENSLEWCSNHWQVPTTHARFWTTSHYSPPNPSSTSSHTPLSDKRGGGGGGWVLNGRDPNGIHPKAGLCTPPLAGRRKAPCPRGLGLGQRGSEALEDQAGAKRSSHGRLNMNNSRIFMFSSVLLRRPFTRTERRCGYPSGLSPMPIWIYRRKSTVQTCRWTSAASTRGSSRHGSGSPQYLANGRMRSPRSE